MANQIEKGIARIAKLDAKEQELSGRANAIARTMPYGQPPPVYGTTLDKMGVIRAKKAKIWNEIRNFVLPGTGKTLWQIAIADPKLPAVWHGKEHHLDFSASDIKNAIKRIKGGSRPIETTHIPYETEYQVMLRIAGSLGEYYGRLPANPKNKKSADMVLDAIVAIRSKKHSEAKRILKEVIKRTQESFIRYEKHAGKYDSGGPRQIKPISAAHTTAHHIFKIAQHIRQKSFGQMPEIIQNAKPKTKKRKKLSGVKPKIPTGMTLQKSLSKTGGQMHFKNGGGKKKPKTLSAKKTKKRVKKGSDNLMTFGIKPINVKTLEDMLK